MNSLRRRTLAGLGWTGAARLLSQLLQLGSAVVLARLLSPKDYGLLGMVLVFIQFAYNISDMGLGASIIQKSTLSDRHLNSVFWLNVATGMALSVLFALAAPLVARFYGEPQLRAMTAVIGLNFFIGSLNVVQVSLLDRALNFRAKFWIEVSCSLSSGIVGLGLAFAGAGVWSLVGQSLIQTVVRLVMLWAQSSWRPALSFEFSAIRELMRFSGHLMGFGALMYWAMNIDKLVIGRTMGSVALGIYSLADKLMRLPLVNISDVTTSVMFPALSSIQHETEAVQRAYLRGSRMIALLTFPMMIALGVLAEPAVLVVYGAKWRESIVVLQLLCVAGMVLATYNTCGWIFLSLGRTDILFRLGIYSTVVRATGVLIGAHWGLMGVAWAYVVGSYAFLWYPTWSRAGRLLHLRFGSLLRNLAGPLACAATMGALLWCCDRWIFGGWVVGLRLAIQMALGILIYAALVRLLRLQAWMEVADVLLEMGGRRSRLLCWVIGREAPAHP